MAYAHDLKLDRASHHLRTLRADIDRWLDTDPYRTFDEFDAEYGERVIKIEVLEPPPEEFGLIVGDVLHNLRSALDSLIYELALTHHGEPLPDNVAKGLMFPVFLTAHQLSSVRERRIGPIHPGAQGIVESLQPYASGKHGIDDPLYVLNELSIMDKHRLPHLTLLLPKRPPRVISPDIGPSDGVFVLGRMEGTTKIFRYARPSGLQEDVILDLRGTLDVGLGPGPTRNLKSVVWNLERLQRYVIHFVVTPLRPFLDDPRDSG